MKKIALILTMLFVLSISVSADGEFPLGGKSCPQGQTCRPPVEPDDNPVLDIILDYLKSIFR